MPNKTTEIRLIPMFCIILLAVGLMDHVIVLPPLITSAKRDAWISVLAAVIPYLIWIAILYYVMKWTNQKAILPWLKKRYGAVTSWCLRLFFICYLFLIGLVTVKETVNWTHGSYLPRTPDLILAITLVLLCGFAAWGGLRAIAIVSGMLLPFVLLFGDFVMSANLPRKNYVLLTPILEHGLRPVLEGCIYVGGGLTELFILILLQDRLKTKVKYWSLSLLGIFLVILILGPVTGALAEFGPFEASELRYPAFEEWRLVKLGRYIQNVDFLSIYQWLSGAFARISIALLLMMELITGNTKDKPSKHGVIWLMVFGVALIAIVALPISDAQFLAFLKNMYLPFSLYASTGVLLLLFTMVGIHTMRTRRRTNG